MKNYRVPFDGPFFDRFQRGFKLWSEHKPNWRQRTIAGVSFNPDEPQAYFFNPDGLVLPLEHHPYKLPLLLRDYARRIEYATVKGTGLYAMPPAQINAMPPSAKGRWVTYWLVDGSEQYANTKEVWEAYAAKQIAQAEQDAKDIEHREDLLWPEHLQKNPRRRAFDETLPSLESCDAWEKARPERDAEIDLKRKDYVAQQVQEAILNTTQRLAEEYAKECAEDKQINAWLRGALGHPPMLAAMQGAA